MTKRVFGIAGRSGSGKTTLLEALLALLLARGLTVNVIKHSHHDITLEPAGKDSARFRAAGAQEVMVSSPYRFAIMHELREQEQPSLAEQLSRLAPADLTLVEGFKHDAIDRIEVYRPATGQAPLYTQEGFQCVAVASDVPKPSDAPASLHWLPLNEPEVIAAFIVQYPSA
ncbi:molybdopterin-guanine dinucleotide biosynthesis protein B [Lampropedia puyangensis]|uniref:Molybdopterin-guanine dinucleotide biosynthesis protein B n=1 Tax=Lampropedia puyangensis TaxID=1330072 RepID=A0A4S8F1B2_9BURK|nr:molybdopterin-guanine dinucleotide biosynthesis protein B [Lampropedia puyangensis]THU01053.1 molybdopterin-guanine dinucleotide biosynthesis protein B [Lampropedia puyangensis]